MWTAAAALAVFCAAVAAVWLAGLQAGPADPRAAVDAGAALAASRGRTFLVVAAHPGDTWRWAGGTIGTLSRRNRVVVVVISSDPAGSDAAPSARGSREGAERRAAAKVGVDRVVFLRHPAGSLDDADVRERLDGLLAGYTPDTVLSFDADTPAGIPPDSSHVEAGRVARAATRARGTAGLLLFATTAPDTAADIGFARYGKADALRVSGGERGWVLEALRWAAAAMREAGFDVAAPRDEGQTTSLDAVAVQYAEVFRATAP